MLPTTAQDLAPLASRSPGLFRKAFYPRCRSLFTSRRIITIAAFSFLLWFLYSYSHSLHKFYPSNISWPYQNEFKSDTAVDWSERAVEVKRAFQHAYHGWQEYASPHDELLPLSNGKQNNFNGWGVTNVDSLDTMYLMGLHEEFQYGVDLVKSMTFTNSTAFISFFETTIRYLGGLLSAYALSHNFALLYRAEELGRLMMPAFHTNSGLAESHVSLASGRTRQSGFGTAWLAEFGTVQLEYKYLAYLTGKKEFYNAANNVTSILYKTNATEYDGLFPMQWSLTTGKPVSNHISIGGMSDSGYEYLLKEWLLTGKHDNKTLELYKRAADSIINHLLLVSPIRGLLYVTDVYMINGISTNPSRKFEHLSCFLPGLFALGVHTLPKGALTREEREMHLWAAEGLAYSCYLMYADQETGLGPEEVTFWGQQEYRDWQSARSGEENADSDFDPDTHARVRGQTHHQKNGAQSRPLEMLSEMQWTEKHRWANRVATWKKAGRRGPVPGLELKKPEPISGSNRDYRVNNVAYLLRPETIESLYLLWRVTGDIQWRERGYEIFKNIERVAKTGSGFATIVNVQHSPPVLKDEMPSFFLAETMKYLYLICAEPDLISLNKFVFNTEAHPLPVFEWTEGMKHKFRIPRT